MFANHAVNWIRSTQGPLFLYFAPYAPHEPYADLPPGTTARALEPYDVPSFGEADVSDKPPYIADLPWTGARRACRAGSVGASATSSRVSIARSARIVRRWRHTKRLSNTMIVFMSDNGYMWGEHRAYFKAKPYEEAMRVPMVVRYDPWTTAARTESHVVLNLDLAQTFAGLGDARVTGRGGTEPPAPDPGGGRGMADRLPPGAFLRDREGLPRTRLLRAPEHRLEVRDLHVGCARSCTTCARTLTSW